MTKPSDPWEIEEEDYNAVYDASVRRIRVGGNPKGLIVLRDRLRARVTASHKAEVDALREERDLLRAFVEMVCREGIWEGLDYSGADAQDWLEEHGLLVKVPADEQFREEWDADTMLALAWSDYARAALQGDAE